MFSKPFQCGAALPAGRRCDALAHVIDVKHTYHKKSNLGRFEELVDEVAYLLECPRCGPWQRVATVHMNRALR